MDKRIEFERKQYLKGLAKNVFAACGVFYLSAHLVQSYNAGGISSRDFTHAVDVPVGDEKADSKRPIWDKDGIYAPLHLVKMNNGKLDIPSDATLYIEVGANSRNTLWEEESGKPEFDSKTYILTFEPIMDKYAKLLTRSAGRPDQIFPLGLSDRNFIVPIAVSPGEPGHTTFNLSPVDGCSSILKANTNHTGPLKGWPAWVNERCAKTVDIRRVPTIALETVLQEWIPEGVKIGRVKIDAQGFDVKVAESFGTEATRVRGVLSMEVIGDNADPLYHGQPKCSEVIDSMSKLGWKINHKYDCGSFTETDFYFERANVGANSTTVGS